MFSLHRRGSVHRVLHIQRVASHRDFHPRAFISVLLAIGLPVILNVPQDNETPAGPLDVLSATTELGAEPRNVRPERVHFNIVWACPHRPGCN